MELTPELSRLAKMLIDAEGLTLSEALSRLQALTLEIVVGRGTQSVAAQNAILTSIAVGLRTFAGGVGVSLLEDAALLSNLPIATKTLAQAVRYLGATELSRTPSARIVIGELDGIVDADAYAWWDNWTAGSSCKAELCAGQDNPLSGIVAGAASVARAFASVRGIANPPRSTIDLWPGQDDITAPEFNATFLPGELWILGMGNLGQAILWSLSSLPYVRPSEVKLVLQDRDRITAENWGTSVLVRIGEYGAYKTAVGEAWCTARGFDVRRVDRWVDTNHRVQAGEPRIAMCGFDSIEARKELAASGYDVIIDCGLGRSHADFERYRVTIFDREYLVEEHFGAQPTGSRSGAQDYESLLGMDKCGAAIFGQIAVAAPYVSAIAGATAVARAIAISTGISVPRNEVRRLADDEPRYSCAITVAARGLARVRQDSGALSG